MNRSKRTAPAKSHPPVPPERIPETIVESFDDVHVVHRPDGYYVQSPEGELGPFATAAEAREALGATVVEQEDAEKILDEIEEDALDTSDWLDPETLEMGEEPVLHVEES